ncbi:unnamed protein product [Camellia sinensis]
MIHGSEVKMKSFSSQGAGGIREVDHMHWIVRMIEQLSGLVVDLVGNLKEESCAEWKFFSVDGRSKGLKDTWQHEGEVVR